MRSNFQQFGGNQGGFAGTTTCGSGEDAFTSLSAGGGTMTRGGVAGTNSQQGTGVCLTTDDTITLDAEATAGLLYMIEEEKMARDLYDAFFEQTGNLVFDRISNSEQQHLDSLLNIANLAGVDTTTLSTTAGVFTNTELQSMYNSLLTSGDDSLEAALQTAIAVEQTDIADLANYSADPELGILGIVYARLELASEHHLAAFTLQTDIVY